MFEKITQFESKIAQFFGAPYAVAVDSCTHALELSLRYNNIRDTVCPTHTYASVPMTLEKLGINWHYETVNWSEFYYLGNTNIVDAATMWRANSYIAGTYTCISFQFKKHMSLGRGGVILLDNHDAYNHLVRMSYDGRARGQAWADQTITTMGYHYYMTPETAQQGMDQFDSAVASPSVIRSWTDYPDLTKTLHCFYKGI